MPTSQLQITRLPAEMDRKTGPSDARGRALPRPLVAVWRLLRAVRAWTIAALVTGLYLAFRGTWRVRLRGTLPAGGGVLAYWHGDQALLAAAPGLLPLAVLVSRSADGQWASRMARWLGLSVVRGSTSRGAVPAALQLVRRARCGGRVGLAVDGPRGPWHRATDGASRLARLGGVPMVPVAGAARRALRLGSWDRMVVPAPFTTVAVVVGDPVTGGVQSALEQLGKRARALAGR